MKKRPRIISVTGPTASGKSDFALSLAKRLNGEIVNIDSVQVFREFDIGSAKPTPEERGTIQHHLIDSCNPNEHFDAKRCADLGRMAIADILKRGKAVIVAGGTGLYLRSLLCGLAEIDLSESDAEEGLTNSFASWEVEIRAKSKDENEYLRNYHHHLSLLDPVAAERVGPNDLVRMRRAAEVRLLTGISLTEFHEKHAHEDQPYTALVIGLSPVERDQLYARIEKRVRQMVKRGLVEEVRGIVERWGEGVEPLRAIGYRQVVQYLKGELEDPAWIEQIQLETRRFAKRQLTWWRNQPRRLGWCELESVNSDGVESEISMFVAGEGRYSEEKIYYLPCAVEF